jgi:thiol peroxidase
MSERQGAITFKGNPMTLIGPELSVGDDAPNATLVATDMSEFQLGSLKGKATVLVTVPSLDTPVCDTEAQRFNAEAAKLDDVEVLVVSLDLPFAQKRWCSANNAEKIRTLSDYRNAEFARAYGLLIKELHLLARAVLVVDKEGNIAYQQIVPEVTEEPDYDAALEAARKVS